MKTKLYVCSLLVFILAACADSNHTVDHDQNDYAILGGQLVQRDNPLSRYVVMLYDTNTHKFCTGTLIHKNVVLTAAHCIEGAASNVSIAFGLNPLSGAYDLRHGYKAVLHEYYDKKVAKQRNDLALLSFKGDLPSTFKSISMISEKFPLEIGYHFSSTGYGRTSGIKVDEKDTQGSGRLRSVDLEIHSFNDDRSQFYVNQDNGRGICNGDSGGPALMRYQGRDYVVGVASAISWTVPGEISADQRNEYLENKDFCKDKSIYMNLQIHSKWVNENLQQVLK